MKKIISIFMVFTMILGSSAMAFADEESEIAYLEEKYELEPIDQDELEAAYYFETTEDFEKFVRDKENDTLDISELKVIIFETNEVIPFEEYLSRFQEEEGPEEGEEGIASNSAVHNKQIEIKVPLKKILAFSGYINMHVYYEYTRPVISQMGYFEYVDPLYTNITGLTILNSWDEGYMRANIASNALSFTIRAGGTLRYYVYIGGITEIWSESFDTPTYTVKSPANPTWSD